MHFIFGLMCWTGASASYIAAYDSYSDTLYGISGVSFHLFRLSIVRIGIELISNMQYNV